MATDSRRLGLSECTECGRDFVATERFSTLCRRCFRETVAAMSISAEELASIDEANQQRAFTRDRDRDRLGEF